MPRSSRPIAAARCCRTVEKRVAATRPENLAESFLLFGLLAEIFMRSNGFNGGMGGSMHAFFPPFGAFPNNAIVGASAGIATGAALARKLAGEDGITVANAGDGSTGCGPVWEAMNFAAMAQYRTLWTDERRGGLPVLFFFNNNFYAMGGQTIGETMGWDRLSRIAAAVNVDALHAETVDGTNPLAVADAVGRKRALLLAGEGPALLDVECYRASGHSTTDVNVYRSKEEMEGWAALDPDRRLRRARWSDAGVLGLSDVEAMKAEVAERIRAVTAAAVDPTIAPPVDVAADPVLIGKLMFSDAEIRRAVQARPGARRSGVHPARPPAGEEGAFRPLSGRREAVAHAGDHPARRPVRGDPPPHAPRRAARSPMARSAANGAAPSASTAAFPDIFPHQRLFNSPISEAAIVATAVGFALEGRRALVELMYGDFIGRAGDEIFNQMAKWHAMSAGELRVPVVLRCSVGSKYGAQHSQDWTALCAHIPGLKVVYPATPYDAKGLMASALSSEDPGGLLREPAALRHDRALPRRAACRRPTIASRSALRTSSASASDVTILTIGPSLYAAIEAARTLEAEHGLSAEVIDARSLVPFDYAAGAALGRQDRPHRDRLARPPSAAASP